MDRKLSQRIGLFFVNIIVTVLLAAGSSDSADSREERRIAQLIEGAKKESRMVLYSTQTQSQSMELLSTFEKRYPFIKTSLYRAGTGRLLPKIITEHQTGRYEADVIQIGGFEAQVFKEKGLAARYMSPEAAFFPDGFKDPDGFWCDVFVNVGVMAYNKKLVSRQDAPKSYQDLFDPKWKGRISIDQEDAEWFGNMLEIFGKESGLKFMKRLGEQELIPRRGRRLQAQLLGAGEFPIAMNLYISSVAELVLQGAPIEPVAAEPLIAKLHPVFLAARAPHPNAAKLYLDFVLSEEGQRVIAKTEIPSRKGIFSANPIVKKIQAMKLNPSDPRLGKHYAEYRSLFEEIVLRKR
ncbi:MAG: extracellular solute-binding protein [Deltaproteobacteria bacterium]|nr:extracellular solute-binding protein [Deltaproteobacteria bacterium]